MNKRFILICTLAAMLLTSCQSTYEFCQIYETKTTAKGQQLKEKDGFLQYEDANCKVNYYLWSPGGNGGFVIYNKTDEVIHIDLAESFFVLNGVANNYYNGLEWSTQASTVVGASNLVERENAYINSRSNAWAYSENASTIGLGSSNSTTQGFSRRVSKTQSMLSSQSNTMTHKEQRIVSIPPKSSKWIRAFSITKGVFLDCNLTRYPEESDKLVYDFENSPFRFSNYICYRVGDSKEKTVVNNGFYVSTITNYAMPTIVEYRERVVPCENMRDDNYREPMVTLYDRYLRDNVCTRASSFFIEYETKSNKKLYQTKGRGYIYSRKDGAYVKQLPSIIRTNSSKSK